MTLLWWLLAIVAGVIVLVALGIMGIGYAYMHGEEFMLEELERKHGLRDD